MFRNGSIRNVIYCSLLLLATAFSVFTTFHSNSSYLNLQEYQAGNAPNPFQSRIGMMPVLRWAHNNVTMQRAAEKIRNKPGGKSNTAFRAMTAEFLASMITSMASAVLLTGFIIWYGFKRFGRIWWLPAALVALMLNLTIAERYETTIWLPYDYPHCLLFGIASICVLEGWWIAVAALMLVDLPMRETSIFIVPAIFLVAWVSKKRKLAIALPIAIAALWIPLQIYVHYRFLGHTSESGMRLIDNLKDLKNPTHWPQMASAFAFLAPALYFNARFLDRKERAMLLGISFPIVFIVVMGVWTETRIFAEWIPVVATLLTVQVCRSGLLAETSCAG